jgi:hypothetical protein
LHQLHKYTPSGYFGEKSFTLIGIPDRPAYSPIIIIIIGPTSLDLLLQQRQFQPTDRTTA